MRSLLYVLFALLANATAQKLEKINTISDNVGKVYHYQPEQVHLAFGDNLADIVVTWSTGDATNQSVVLYGENYADAKRLVNVTGDARRFVDGGKKQHSQYVHKVTLRDLKPQTRYEYSCGSDLGWSARFSFTTPPAGSDWQPSLAIFGDMGNENAQSLARLQQDTQQGMYDAIIHVGDFAYDMDTENARVGDEFMRQVETIAAYVPYMVCPGNHEEKYNFSNYKTRFNMPGERDSLWYSFDLGPIHFVSFSTEVYYFMQYGFKLLTKQYEWLENDLREANKPENRAQRPWIITYGHRPMYCSDEKEYDCNEKLETFIRQGLPLVKWFGLEDLFYKNGVDVEIFAHEHFYTRLWPIYDFKVYNGSTAAPYTNPKAPIQIITGSAGCKEEREPFSETLPAWNAYHSNDYGYTRMKAHNHTHLYFEQVSDDKNGEIVDSFWIIKDKHVAYNEL
ncbi:acid phosphatase type 7 isoform X1 [Bactrocera neohumeralis]|uniref:acid phosphatase type 7 isoform X1 n=1 Tax=Bactrocera tryoni TaxID=59916 RepID=UPI001A999530|nr:acid phosphatase type 7 isoform X1 [Bactrocera tryoni]XP_050328717.1 acid phosphatase type 7 isoform X1 [Bactrocera neohumeralis]